VTPLPAFSEISAVGAARKPCAAPHRAGAEVQARVVRQSFTTIEVEARAPGLVEITDKVEACVADSDIQDGLVTVFIRHTSASLVIQENADPDVRHDLDAFLRRIVPEDSRLYRHTAEGDDDMPAHIRSALTATQLSIPLRGGQMRLGTWQGIYLFEHRRMRSRRSIDVHVIGE
jgi:secondary thiamine-phosphate synthase enzyme